MSRRINIPCLRFSFDFGGSSIPLHSPKPRSSTRFVFYLRDRPWGLESTMAHIAMGNLLSCTVLATFPVLTHLSIIITYASSLTFPQPIDVPDLHPVFHTHPRQDPSKLHTPCSHSSSTSHRTSHPPLPSPTPKRAAPTAHGGKRVLVRLRSAHWIALCLYDTRLYYQYKSARFCDPQRWCRRWKPLKPKPCTYVLYPKRSIRVIWAHVRALADHTDGAFGGRLLGRVFCTTGSTETHVGQQVSSRSMLVKPLIQLMNTGPLVTSDMAWPRSSPIFATSKVSSHLPKRMFCTTGSTKKADWNMGECSWQTLKNGLYFSWKRFYLKWLVTMKPQSWQIWG